MKLRDIIDQIDKTNPTSIDLSDLYNSVDLSYCYNIDDDKLEEHLKAYYVHKWLCTDTWVGYMVYFLDDEFVATSLQTARKNDTHFKFASKEAFIKIRDFLQSLNEPEFVYDLVDLEEEIQEEQPVHFSEQILTPYVNYNGEKVLVINKRLTSGDWLYNNKNIEIKRQDGSTSIVKVDDVTIPICLDKTKDYRDWDHARANG